MQTNTDDTIAQSPQPADPEQESGMPTPPAQVPEWKRPTKKFPWTIVLVVAVVCGIVAGVSIATQKPIPDTTAPFLSVTSPVRATPTPIRTLSPVATDSAFLLVESKLASMTATLQTVQITDPSLSPPSIELPLGFPIE